MFYIVHCQFDFALCETTVGLDLTQMRRANLLHLSLRSQVTVMTHNIQSIPHTYAWLLYEGEPPF